MIFLRCIGNGDADRLLFSLRFFFAVRPRFRRFKLVHAGNIARARHRLRRDRQRFCARSIASDIAPIFLCTRKAAYAAADIRIRGIIRHQNGRRPVDAPFIGKSLCLLISAGTTEPSFNAIPKRLGVIGKRVRRRCDSRIPRRRNRGSRIRIVDTSGLRHRRLRMRRHIAAGIHLPGDIRIRARIHDAHRDRGRHFPESRRRRGKCTLRFRRRRHIAAGRHHRILSDRGPDARFQRTERHHESRVKRIRQETHVFERQIHRIDAER